MPATYLIRQCLVRRFMSVNIDQWSYGQLQLFRE